MEGATSDRVLDIVGVPMHHFDHGEQCSSPCAPITLKVVSGSGSALVAKSMECVCRQGVDDFAAELVIAVEECALDGQRSTTAIGASLLLQAQLHGRDHVFHHPDADIRLRTAFCLVRTLHHDWGTEDLLDLRQFMREVGDMGCDCAGREISLMTLESPLLSTIKNTC